MESEEDEDEILIMNFCTYLILLFTKDCSL